MNTPKEFDWFSALDECPFESLKVDLAVQVEKALDEHDLSRSDLAQRANRSRSWVTKVLSADSNLTLETLCLLAEALKKEVKIDLIDINKPRKVTVNYAHSFKSSSQRTPKPITAKIINDSRHDGFISYV